MRHHCLLLIMKLPPHGRDEKTLEEQTNEGLGGMVAAYGPRLELQRLQETLEVKASYYQSS